MKAARSRQKKMRVRNRLGMLGISMVTMLLLGIFAFQARSLQSELNAYDVRAAELEEQIEAEQERTKEIDETKAYMGTDEYAEEVARNRLGLVKENEIVFEEEE